MPTTHEQLLLPRIPPDTIAARLSRHRKSIVPILLVVAVAAVISFFVLRAPAASPTTGAAPAPTALVKTALPTQMSMSDVLTAFGQVMTGLDVAISFPRAGQVSRLLVIPGQRVQRGTPLVTLTSDPTARLAYTQAQNAVDFAQGELKRNQELLALQLATQSQVDAARRALHDADAMLATQRMLGGAISTATVTAPFDGVVDSVEASQGDRILPGAVILQLGHIDMLRVRLGIEPTDARLVRVGMPVTLTALDDSTRSVSVSITESQGLVDPKTQLIDAVAMVPATRAPFLVPGMHVRATIKVGQQASWAVPRSAVLTDSSGAYVFQISAGKARRVKVTPATESQGLISITGPIDPKLRIVVLGNYELEDGMPVREGTLTR
ncbi:MAG: Cobalt/zinc/cadmium efflux transporter [Gemmatimonadetes bacterium]|nr:Cobalt/zinc/cadmium efflux transporter [Gemmatimonadota bacterium]